MAFIKSDISKIDLNPFTKIGKEWMLISAKHNDTINTMTASWGGLGIIWNKPVITTYIRPQRYTKQLIDSQDYFTICFFDLKYKDILSYLGKVSGKDVNKIDHTNLHPIITDDTVYFQEASMVLICKKLYHQELSPTNFIDQKLCDNYYQDHDYHEMYIAEIKEILIRD